MVPELAWIRLGIQDRDLGQLGRRLSNGASGQSPWQVRRYHAMRLRLSAQPQWVESFRTGGGIRSHCVEDAIWLASGSDNIRVVNYVLSG